MVSSAVLSITWLFTMASLWPRLLERACHAIEHGKTLDLLAMVLSVIVKVRIKLSQNETVLIEFIAASFSLTFCWNKCVAVMLLASMIQFC